MCGPAIHRHEAQHMRIEIGSGDARLAFAAVRAFEKRDHAAKIIARGIGARRLAKGAAVAEQAFEKAAVLAGQCRYDMFAKIAAGHYG